MAYTSSDEWTTFFKDAGLPSKISAEYAFIFYSNRIYKSQLEDLNESYLRMMGINKVGDIITILKHARTVMLASDSATERTPIQNKRTLPQPVSKKRVNISDDRNDEETSEEYVRSVNAYRTTQRKRANSVVYSDDDQEPIEEFDDTVRAYRTKQRKRANSICGNIDQERIEELDDVVRVYKTTQRKRANSIIGNVDQEPIDEFDDVVRELPKQKIKRINNDVLVVPGTTSSKKRIVQPPPEIKKTIHTRPVHSSTVVMRKSSGYGPPKKKTDVFSRLDAEPKPKPSTSAVVEEPVFQITNNHGGFKLNTKSNESIFKRLGNKQSRFAPNNSVDDNEMPVDDSFDQESMTVNNSYNHYKKNYNFIEDQLEAENYEDEYGEESEAFVEEEQLDRDDDLKIRKLISFKNKAVSKPAVPYMGILKKAKIPNQIKKSKLTTMRADEEQRKSILKNVPRNPIKPFIQKTIVRPLPVHPTQRTSTSGFLVNPHKNSIMPSKKPPVKQRLGINRSFNASAGSNKFNHPTQVESVGSTTMPPIRNIRQKIVYDLDESIQTTTKSVTFSEPEVVPKPRGSIALRTGIYKS